MACFSTDRFASAAATGTDWRDAARQVLEQLGNVSRYNFGFLYITEALAGDAGSILDLFRSVTRIEHWVGSAATGVIGTDGGHAGKPAIAALVGHIPADDFFISPATGLDTAEADAGLDAWLDAHDTMLVLAHGAPAAGGDAAATIAAIERRTGGFVAGGLNSVQTPVQFADGVEDDGFSGAVFSHNIPVATALTQGCAPVGPVHTVTRCEDNIMMELDGQRAFDVFAADLKQLAALHPPGAASEEEGSMKSLFRGEIHVAFPVSGSDQRDYLVRQALGIDPDKGWIAVAQTVRNGDRILFVHRDADTVRADLSRMLLELRTRVTRERGVFAPAGALYISCVARVGFGGHGGGEAGLIREIIGDVPLAGFYAGGEISGGRLYGYTGVLILFL
jgi:small ligand-binding sensory domain FIST